MFVKSKMKVKCCFYMEFGVDNVNQIVVVYEKETK